MNVKLYIVA